MKKLKEVETIIKKSRFIGIRYEVTSKDEVDEILLTLKKEHKKARHIPYAYKIGPLEKKSDDKEPSGTAGSPIHNIIIRNNLDNTLIVVIRYFGGIKLGSGGLIRAYSEAANSVVKSL